MTEKAPDFLYQDIGSTPRAAQDRFSQTFVKAVNRSPEKTTTVRTGTHSVMHTPEFLHDLEFMSVTELRKKYPREACSHRNGKHRCKNSGYIWHPDLDDFRDFLYVVGECPGEGYTLDRVDSSDPEYAPGKIRWASKSAQTHNRRNTRFLTDSQGRRKSVSEWARRSGIPAKTITQRTDRQGWSVDEAISLPVGERRKRAGTSDTATIRLTSSTPYISIWKQVMADTYRQAFCSFSSKEAKMIKSVAARFQSEGLIATEALTFILQNWKAFTCFALNHYGAYGNIPAYPTLEWLTKYINAAGNFYLRERQETVVAKIESVAESAIKTQHAEFDDKACLQHVSDSSDPADLYLISLRDILRKLEGNPDSLDSSLMQKCRECCDLWHFEVLRLEGNFRSASNQYVIRRTKFLVGHALTQLHLEKATGTQLKLPNYIEILL